MLIYSLVSILQLSGFFAYFHDCRFSGNASITFNIEITLTKNQKGLEIVNTDDNSVLFLLSNSKVSIYH